MNDSAPAPLATLEPAPKTSLRARAALVRATAHSTNPVAGLTLSALFPRELLPRPDAVVSGYWPFRTEIDPRPLMARLERLGARLALPVTPARGSGAPLCFRRWRDGAALSRGAFGVPEPGPECETVEPDLLLVPLLAFDRAGRRLGYGQGHYDRTLCGLKARRPTLAIGVAFAAQEVTRVPTDPHDQLLDGVVTERVYIAPRKDT
jgi:5-formyltetrahydrofolate cyclo-ligase